MMPTVVLCHGQSWDGSCPVLSDRRCLKKGSTSECKRYPAAEEKRCMSSDTILSLRGVLGGMNGRKVFLIT